MGCKMNERVILSVEESRFLYLLSCDKTELQVREAMKLPETDYKLLVKGIHEKLGTTTLHGLVAQAIVKDPVSRWGLCYLPS